MRDRARVAVLLELGEDRAEPRPGGHAGLADELVAAHQRRGRTGLRAGRGEQLARDFEVGLDRRPRRCAPRVASRSATVKIVMSAL